MKNIILIIAMVLFIGCEKEIKEVSIMEKVEVAREILESGPVFTLCAFTTKDTLSSYTILFIDPTYKDGNFTQEVTFTGKWILQIPYDADFGKFAIIGDAYYWPNPDSSHFNHKGGYLTKDSISTSDKYDLQFRIFYSDSIYLDSICLASQQYYINNNNFYNSDGSKRIFRLRAEYNYNRYTKLFPGQ